MANYEHGGHITDEERRDFLKALGVSGVVVTSGVGLQEIRNTMAASSTAELAPVGQAIQSDLSGVMDAEFIAEQQTLFASATNGLSTVAERGLPVEEPRHEFGAVEEAGRPIYEHLTEVGFFESTTRHLPAFNPSYLESAVETFVSSKALSNPLARLGLTGGAGVDLLAEVVTNAKELSEYHWIATDEIPRAEIEFGKYIPSMTQGAAGGALLWLKDLDHYLWSHEVLLTEDILADAQWHGQSMAAGLDLMTEGAKAVAAKDSTYNDGELAALLSTGFAIQAISQGLLPQDVYWVSEGMRSEQQTNTQSVRANR